MNLSKIFMLAGTALLALLTACEKPAKTTIPEIDQAYVQSVVETISSDEYQGRRPFTEGETRTTAYLENQLKSLGVQPGNGDSYFQEVPLVELTSTPQRTMPVVGEGVNMELAFGDDYVVRSPQVTESINVTDAELVFCGYGIVAPEYGWNDYEGIDMTGKIALVMVNDPGYASEDSTLFKGNTMTYYGRWTYKYEEAARQGAAGVLVIHETGAAGYPWFVPRGGMEGARLYLDSEDGNAGLCQLQGWITLGATARLIKASQAKGQRVFKKALDPDFKPIPLGLTASTGTTNAIKKDRSNNVIGMIPGATKPNEYIIYTAHWDHLGVDEPVDGDSIYNGAMDNASGTANVMGIAKAFSEMGQAPDRSVVFLFVTAEEQGLLGSAYYGAHPIFPPAQTVANLNMDGMNVNGPMKDVTVVGFGQSELEALLAEEAAKQGRYMQAEQEPEKGFYFRSDHFNFAKIGIPAINGKGGYDHMEKGKEYAMERKKDYTSNHYHRPSDEFNAETWSLDGMIQDAELYFKMGLRLANEGQWPNWLEGSEFKAIRDASR